MSAVPVPAAAARGEADVRAVVALCAALALPSAIAAGFDPRMLDGAGVWAKPLKFQLSFALHWATVLVLLHCLAPAARASRGLAATLVAGALATLIEVLVVTLQAARGRASHFNGETLLDALLYYGVMGPAALVIVGATAAIGLRVLRAPSPAAGDGLARGAGLGLLLSGAVTLAVAAPLAAGAIDGPGHFVGGVRSDAHGLPLTGWSTTGGDLRVPHFFATHLAQALPLAGWAADRIAPRHARAVVHAAAALGVAAVAATFVQAAAGRPFVG